MGEVGAFKGREWRESGRDREELHDCTARNYITKSVFVVVYEYTGPVGEWMGTYSIHSSEARLAKVLPRLQHTYTVSFHTDQLLKCIVVY